MPQKVDARLIFNQRETARIFGVSVQAFAQWDIEPHGHRGRAVLYYLPDVIKQRGLSAQDAGSNSNAVAEKARLDRVRADRIELDLQRELREVVPVEEAARLLESVLVACRLKLLALPTKAAPRVHGCKTLPQTKAVLTDSLMEVA